MAPHLKNSVKVLTEMNFGTYTGGQSHLRSPTPFSAIIGNRHASLQARHPCGGLGQTRHPSIKCKAEVASAEEVEEEKSDAYSEEMQSKMGGSMVYRHEDGMNFAYVLDDVIVGSCLQTVQDLDRLVDEEKVGTIFCLQQDSDMAYFNLDIRPILDRVKARGDVHHIRHRINDFDPYSLRLGLPRAARIVADEIAQGRKVYIHCTAGLGRAPATALAYMYWFRDLSLEDAFAKLRAVRPCNPRIQAIREATCDLLVDNGKLIRAKLIILRSSYGQSPQVAGLDAGWGQRMQMNWDGKRGHFVLERHLPAGKFPFKLVFGDRWALSSDHPTLKDGEHTNNYLEVVSSNPDPAAKRARARLLQEGGCLTADERQQVQQQIQNLPHA